MLLALHFVHLSADFPNFSQWTDWAKYTDEGWYGDAAIRHFQLGHWYVPGAFNPAVALPVWPLLEAIVFRFTGVSLVAARALTVSIFAITSLVAWLLLQQGADRANPTGGQRQRSRLAASSAVLILAASPFCFVFSRLAILEPLMVLLMLLALLTAAHVRPVPADARAELRRNGLLILTLGLLLPTMVLTKTTAVALLPAVFWMLFAVLQYRIRSLARVGGAVMVIGLGLWSIYFFCVVTPHYLADYQYLFDANKYTFLASGQLGGVLMETARNGVSMGKPLYIAGCICVCLALVMVRRLRAHPLIPALLLWIAGYACFLIYHNSPQPRYFYVLAVPLALLVASVVAQLLLPWLRVHAVPGQIVSTGALALLLTIVLPEIAQTVQFVRHPDYTFVNAAQQIRATIAAAERQDPAHSRLVLSISGSDLSLMTGLPSICDDFGTLELSDELKLYDPGWYIAWNHIEDDKMNALTPRFQVVRVASFPALDDPERNLLILYRLDSRIAPQTTRGRKPTMRRLRLRKGRDLRQPDSKH